MCKERQGNVELVASTNTRRERPIVNPLQSDFYKKKNNELVARDGKLTNGLN